MTAADESAPPGAGGEGTKLQTLSRGLQVLNIVARSRGTATAKSVARQLGLNLSTCYHLLRTLRAEGYVVRVEGGAFDIGPSGGRLGHYLDQRFAPPPEITALVHRLHRKTQETSYLCGWHHGSIVMQQFISGTRPVAVGGVHQLDVGYKDHLHARASCKAVLAYMSEEVIAAMFDGLPFPALTPKTVGSYEGLLVQLKRVRKAGYALDLEEFSEGVCCVSAPYFDAHGQPAGSFTVSVPTDRFSAGSRSLAAAVLETASMATEWGRRQSEDAARTRDSRPADLSVREEPCHDQEAIR
ncbi:IclR family transcriptional regulator [Streptomyces sp. R39]|uniref:IclR family transcriptional regulator n=1 Tax=Streptomyces sp. R39 TaxID=3238631 RepID=A0AB39R3K3_9ACTN